MSRSSAPRQLLSVWRWRQAAVECADSASATWSRSASTSQPSEAAQRAVRFSKQRSNYEQSLSELRKQWAQERAAAEAAAAARAEFERQEREAARAAREQRRQAEKGRKLQAYLAQQAEERELRILAKSARLQRQQLREEVLDVAREERRDWLIQQSKSWIAADNLQQRIEEAINNPVPLFPHQHK